MMPRSRTAGTVEQVRTATAYAPLSNELGLGELPLRSLVRRELLVVSRPDQEKDDRLPGYFYREKLGPHDVVFEVKDEDLDEVYNW